MPSSNGVADARAKVKRLADADVDVIKLIDHDLMTMEEVRAVVDEAHKRNLPAVAHSHRPEEIRPGVVWEISRCLSFSASACREPRAEAR